MVGLVKVTHTRWLLYFMILNEYNIIALREYIYIGKKMSIYCLVQLGIAIILLSF